MKIVDIRNLPDDEIELEIKKARTKIFKFHFHAKGSSQENPGEKQKLKADVARMLTVLRERQLAKERAE